jgi:quinohemoprotein ethanol dehydrogenase
MYFHCSCVAFALTLAAGVDAASTESPAPIANVNDTRLLGEQSGDNWLVKGGSFKQQQFSQLKDINTDNVSRLGLTWTVDFDDPMGLTAEPIVVDGIIYMSAPRSVVYAIDASSGRNLWKFDPHVRLDASIDSSSSARVNRGVAVWSGKVYVGTGDGRLIAIDADKGTQIWEARVVDAHLTGITGAPRVARGKVFIGYNGADEQIRGSIAAFDPDTGREVWRFWTVPGDPAKGFENKAMEMAATTWSGPEWWRQGGGTVWDPITFDSATGLLLFGTSKSFRGEGPQGQMTAAGMKLFSGSIVAVHADTGEYAWHYQTSTPQRQTENFHIVLADVNVKGRLRHVAMTVPRNGTLYVIDASSGTLISQKPLVQQGWLHPPDGAPNEHMGYPGVSVHGVEDCPESGCFGAHSWWPMSYSPVTGLLYVPLWDRRRADDHPGAMPMLGRLLAWDPVRHSKRWSVEHPVVVNSGVLSTAGNLVFQGEGTGEFAAYSAVDGSKLWSVQTGSAIDAVPVTFKNKGEQYVLMPVGWGGMFRMFSESAMSVTPQSKYGPARLLAFKLDSHMPMPSINTTIPRVPKPPAQHASTESIERGEKLADSHSCTDCHSLRFDGAGRWILNGGIPDLRYMPPEAYRDWYAIVLGGSHRAQGMLAFGEPHDVPEMTALTAQDADDILAFVIDRAWAAYNVQEHRAAP